MKLLRFVFLLFVISCSASKTPVYRDSAEPLFGTVAATVMPYGQDTLGAAKYPQVAIKNADSSQGSGHFSNTFGDIVPVLRGEIAKHVPFIRVHLMWRDRHDFSIKDFPAIVKEAKRLCPLINQNPQIHWYLSGACEHNLNQSNARLLAQQVLSACPQVIYVNTPMGNKGAVLPEYINEYHGAEARPRSPKYAFSFDGSSAEDSDVTAIKARFPNAEYFMIWGPRYNGRWESNDSTPRPNRKGWPDTPYIESLEYLATDKGPTSLPRNYLWKSHAENHGPNDKKAEHPVAIIPIKTKAIELKRGNTVVERMPYYGPYADGRHRYYSIRYGYQTGKVDLWVNNKRVGNINAGFREGGYR